MQPTPHTPSLDVPINRVLNFLFYLIYRVHARPVHTDDDTSQIQNHFGTISVGSVLLQSSHKISPWRLLTGAPAPAASSPTQHGGISLAATSTMPHWASLPGNQPYSQSPASSVYGGGSQPNQIPPDHFDGSGSVYSAQSGIQSPVAPALHTRSWHSTRIPRIPEDDSVHGGIVWLERGLVDYDYIILFIRGRNLFGRVPTTYYSTCF
jgi:hypothetical protein